MPQKDQRWVVDQIMASEVPDALDMIQRGMDGVLSTEPRPASVRHALAFRAIEADRHEQPV